MNPLKWGRQQQDERGTERRTSGLAKQANGEFTLRRSRNSKKGAPGTISGLTGGRSMSSEISPTPEGIPRKQLPAGTSALIPQLTSPTPSQPGDRRTWVSSPAPSGSSHQTQTLHPQQSGSWAGPTSTEQDSETPAGLHHLMPGSPVKDDGITAAAQAHVQLFQQLQEQVGAFKDEAGRNEEAIRLLTTNLDSLVDHTKLQADHVKYLEHELQQLRGSHELVKKERQQQLDRANGLSQNLSQAVQDRDRFFNDAREWQRKFESVNQKGTKSKDKILDLTVQVNDLKITLRQVRGEADKVEGLNAQVAKQKQQEQKLKFDFQQKVEAVVSLERDLDQCRSRIVTLETQLEEHKREIEKMEDQLDHSTSAFSTEPEMAIPTLPEPTPIVPGEDSRWMPEADFDISRKFDSLWQDLTSWSKLYARKRNIDLASLSKWELQHLQRRLEPAMARDGDGTTALSSLIAMGHKGPSVMLLAILANELYAAFFNNPFFFMSEQDSASRTTYVPGREDVPDTTVAAFFSCLREEDPGAANEWRVQTMRLLHSSGGTHQSGTQQPQLRERLQAGREVSIHSFTKSFLDSLPAALVDQPGNNESHQRYQELSEIVSDAAELALRLSTQKDQVQVQCMKDLSPAGKPIRFYARSSTLQHHALHNLQMEDSERSLDGRHVLLVVHPLVIALGSKADGSRTSERVWKRAIVWMGA